MLTVVRYNAIPEIDSSPEITATVLADLAKLFVKHNIHGTFGIGLLHSHCKLEEDEVMLSTKLQESEGGYWNKATKIQALDVPRLRGSMFKLVGNGKLVAYKLAQGPTLDLCPESASFFRDLADRLGSRGLMDILGLQRLHPAINCEVEFDFGAGGTVVLNEANTTHGPISHTTGWAFAVDVDGIISCKGTTVHASTTKGPHRVFIDSKLLQTESNLMKILEAYAVLVSQKHLCFLHRLIPCSESNMYRTGRDVNLQVNSHHFGTLRRGIGWLLDSRSLA